MARINTTQAGGRNVLAFLDMLAWSEGTSISKYMRDDGYDVIVGGLDSPNTFTSYAEPPGVLFTVNSQGLKFTAAGRYQLLKRYAASYTALLSLPDFGPVSQDRIAIKQITEQGGLVYLQAGRVADVIGKCSNIWASLPGNNYGQRVQTVDDLVAHYIAAGGVMA